jgi:hypothetical protein
MTNTEFPNISTRPRLSTIENLGLLIYGAPLQLGPVQIQRAHFFLDRIIPGGSPADLPDFFPKN